MFDLKPEMTPSFSGIETKLRNALFIRRNLIKTATIRVKIWHKDKNMTLNWHKTGRKRAWMYL